jgi:uncharacterized protein (TIGR03437 family)
VLILLSRERQQAVQRHFSHGLLAEVQITFDAAAAPFMVAGAMQVNARVPANAPAGDAVPVRLKVGNNTSPEGVTVALR